MSHVETISTTWTCDWCGEEADGSHVQGWKNYAPLDRDFCPRDHCQAVYRWLDTGERRALPGQRARDYAPGDYVPKG